MTRLFLRRHDEDGAVLVWVALLTVALFGFAAIAVDVAVLLQEHRELQNGADAAALAVAYDCATDVGNFSACSGDLGSWDATAEFYADENAEDDVSGALVDLTRWSNNKVKVTATTVQGGNAPGQLSLVFARVLGMETGTTTARAVAKWGPPGLGSLPTVPITIAQCEYDIAIGDPSNLKTGPPWTTGHMGPEVTLFLHQTAGSGGSTAAAEPQYHAAGAQIVALGEAPDNPGKGKDKPSEEPTPEPTPTPTPDPGNGNGNGNGNPPPPPPPDEPCDLDGGQDAPGGFGWLQKTGASTNDICQALVQNDTGYADTGNNKECTSAFLQNNFLNKVVVLPIYTAVTGTGNNITYSMADYVGFYVTAYKFPGANSGSGVKCEPPEGKGNSGTCIKGWFTTAVAPGGTVGSGTGLGVHTVALDE